MLYTIYSLVCPETNEAIYVGQTSLSIEKRLSMHLNCRTSAIGKYLYENKVNPSIKPIDEIDTNNLQEALSLENYWIEKLKNDGLFLLNVKYGRKSLDRGEKKVQISCGYVPLKYKDKLTAFIKPIFEEMVSRLDQ